jgi:uncharacterized protein YdeI (YjbR/CyaY-like superfamily)
MTPTFFETPARFRAWLEQHQASAKELWVGFYKVKSGKGGMVYPQALDEALCYGWIDGMVRRVDEVSYMQRFTPRRKGSSWSLVNTRRAAELIAAGRMRPSGLAAFEARVANRTGVYSFEQRAPRLEPAFKRQLDADAGARDFLDRQPPSYRRLATWWVMSAKKPETRARRFATLLADSRAGRRIRAATPGAPPPRNAPA